MTKEKFYIKTLGCKVNQYESQVIRENFLKNGYLEAKTLDEAKVCVVNTCTVTSTSDSKSFRLIRNIHKKGNKRLIVTGCIVEDKDLDLSRLSGADFIIKNKDKYKIPYIINRRNNIDEISTVTGLKNHTRVFVKIQDGCNNVCSYCKVTIVRGCSTSRPIKEVLCEVAKLIENGSKEVVLTGVCLGSYGKDLSKDLNLSKLIEEICKIKGDWRLRLSSIEPKDINSKLINQFTTQKRLCRHLHIPFQSGDDYILKKMDRSYKEKDYLDIIYRLKKVVPDIAISIDIMAGFPGETEERFQNTVDFIKLVKPMRVHVFPFSKRKGTKAYNYKDNITRNTKKEREETLLDIVNKLYRDFIAKFLNKEVRVLVEDRDSSEGCLQGYTEGYIKVYIEGEDSLKGQLVNCRLTLTKQKVHGILLPYCI